MAIGAAASLAVLTSAADLDLVGYEMTMLVADAGRLAGPAVPDVAREPPEPAPGSPRPE